MKQALTTMLSMQDRMNTRIHPNWAAQGFEWYRAIWIECGELIEHYGYKWWKGHEPDMEQMRLEVIDIWHFGLSDLFREGLSIEDIATRIEAELTGSTASEPRALLEATEALAAHALTARGFSPALFWQVLLAAGMNFEQLFRAYVGKNVLNFFRQDHGYQQGTYVKTWDGREDNEHLVDLLARLEPDAPDFADRVYAALNTRYRELVVGR